MKKLINEFLEKILTDAAWRELSENFEWTEQLLDKHKHNVDWDLISQNKNIVWTPSMLDKFKQHIDWNELSNTRCETILTEESLERFKDDWDWAVLSANADLGLTYSLIDRFVERWDWSKLIDRWHAEELYSIDFLERYADWIPLCELQTSRLWTALVEEREKALKLRVIA